VARGSAAGREDEEDVARACELVEVDAADRAQRRVLRCQRRLERGVARGGRVRDVDAVRYAEGCEARERRLRDAAEAEEADRARWRERARAQLRAGEEERGEVEVGPLFVRVWFVLIVAPTCGRRRGDGLAHLPFFD
jgi:hypothetical protein